eukprot:438839_1
MFVLLLSLLLTTGSSINTICEYVNSETDQGRWGYPMGACTKRKSDLIYPYKRQCNGTHVIRTVHNATNCNDTGRVDMIMTSPSYTYSCSGISCNIAWINVYRPNGNTESNCSKSNIGEFLLFRPYVLDLCLKFGSGYDYRIASCDFDTNIITFANYNDSACTELTDTEIFNQNGSYCDTNGAFWDFVCVNNGNATTSSPTSSTTTESSTSIMTTIEPNASVQIQYIWYLLIVYLFC